MQDETSSHIDLLHNKVRLLLAEANSEDYIVNELQKEGVEEHYAKMLIQNVKDEKDNRKKFSSHLLMGIIITVGGIFINLMSYQIAESNNSFSFYIYWGIIALGISMIFRAFIIYRK